MVFKEAMRKYDAKDPMVHHAGRRSLCCSCMTIRVQKRYSFVAGLTQAHPLPKNPNTPYFPRGQIITHAPVRASCDYCASRSDHPGLRGAHCSQSVIYGRVRGKNATDRVVLAPLRTRHGAALGEVLPAISSLCCISEWFLIPLWALFNPRGFNWHRHAHPAHRR